MAVPKKKRYKQVIQLRRSIRNLNLLKNHNINLTKYSNFVNKKALSNSVITSIDKTCACCLQNKSKNICVSCYTNTFIDIYNKHLNK